MLARTSLRLPKTAARCISSSTPARVLQQTPATSGGSAKTSIPPVSQGEKAWCDIYGVDYEKQIQEALHESPAAAQGAAKQVNYPTAGASSASKAQSKADIWNVVFGGKKSA
ncbi:cAMP-dependent protein kinase regulatory subunit [Phytophthora cinnamomi]|uniref:cAMP-dependent protein kinase regulatory subunit n=1 Tax=Phytophthora cinnamomi TaxID=4785 RepID=UPI00355A611B|nr:cAMP-dependent protein kinase regulatory subunit [Phytophthora cinnamomi]